MPPEQVTPGGLTTLDHVVIGCYLLSMLAMGLSIARRQKSTEDFFVAGRSMPAWAVGISLFASLLSTITYLGMPGEMFRTGIAFLTRQIPVPLVLIVVMFVWIPFFMRLRLTSAYEYLERRYNYPTRALGAVLCLLLLFGWIAVVVLTAAGALVQIAALDAEWFFGSNYGITDSGETRWTGDADMHLMIVSIGLFSVVYTTMGGIRAVVWTDVIQFLVLMVGAVFTMGYIAWNTGSGLGDWIELQRSYRHEQVAWFDWDVRTRSTVFTISLAMFFWFVCTHGANQVALQRYFTVRDMSAARRSYLVSAVASILIGITLAGVGIALMYYIQDHNLPAGETIAHLSDADPDDLTPDERGTLNRAQDAVFPQFIRQYLPAGMRGMVVAALFAAAMSTIDSGANSVSTILTVDFLRRFRSGDASTAGELRQARFFTAAMGVVVIVVSVALYHLAKDTDIITLCQKGFNCFLGPLGALFFLGLFSPRATAKTVLPAVLIGELVGVGASYSSELCGIAFSTHLVVPSSWLATVVVSETIGFATNARVTDDQRTWMWKAVVLEGSQNETEDPAT